MRHINVQQGSDEWLRERAGLVTASNLDEILTPKKLERSKSDFGYMCRLVAEWFLGYPILTESETAWMTRGKELEAKAVDWWEWEANRNATVCGLCVIDAGPLAGKVAASPDRLVGDDGVLEIKCPSAEKHMAYLLGGGGVPEQYKLQTQAQLWVCERTWGEFVSYNPSLPNVRVRFERDDKVIDAIESAVLGFVEQLDAAKARLAEQKAERESVLAASANEHPF